ncbi:hypothetical protein P3X46_021900 [Hevea brasiliensis]|uniref:non-specific serine/threonine protein kinase n=1 Tax=Hevea brasiliensis TaxID=3981 RepID=A0ABQ9LH03_HEVBR|nr:hypothetical protein P3X46_021900 [Hevea brasiliensis]
MAKWLFLCIAFFCWSLYTAKPDTCLQNVTDRLALLAFKQAIHRDSFQVLSSWNDSVYFCNWHGVSCSRRHPDRVISLILNSQGLAGSLSPHIGNFSFLRVINFEKNSFNGEMPQQIGRLRRLRSLTLANNSFTGNIPANLSRCSNLVYLDLINNKLVENIPAELGSLAKLGALGLARNNLAGSIPSSTGNLSSLYRIDLRTNGLQGQIPKELSRLQKLEYLLFAENNLVGEIPHGLFNISSVIAFNVNFNQLHGTIPFDIGLTLTNLSSLGLSFNKFTGSIPVSLSNASALYQISFSGNNFTDDLSFIDPLTNCSKLQQIYVTKNFLNGSIPKSIANLSKDMWILGLSENQLQNSIPLGLENLVNLRILQLGWNFLSGPILIDFGKFQRLQYVTLSSNNFSGTIPSSLGNLTFLSGLYMSLNKLQGNIPPSLGSCPNLIELDLSHNSLSGSIPPQVIGLSSLSVGLYLSNNELSGPIPSEVGSLQNLLLLDLSNNRLSETIPSSIGNSLQGLRKLDISRNNFSGKIPVSLAALDGLNLLNLSFNRLEGEVPKHGIFLNSSAVSLLGNNQLCGGITELKLPPCQSSKNKLSFMLKVTISVVGATLCLLLLVGSLIFWHRKRMPRIIGISMPSFKHQLLRISYAELFKATDGFSAFNITGTGSYSSIYKGILGQAGIEIAVKVFNLQRGGASHSFMSECKALRTIRHRNLVKLLSACSSIDFEGNDFKALVYEFMPNGSLEKWLHPENAGEDGQQTVTGNLKLIQRLNIAIDIACAIECLHNGCPSTIIHGDLKPSNVLLDDEMTAHVGDFGLAKIVSAISDGAEQYQSGSLAIRGSIGYVAPEYGMGDLASVEGDIYSYGILLLEMFTRKKPTDSSFKNGLNLHIFVEKSFTYKVMEIIDPCILSEVGRESLINCLVSAMRIGVACFTELPTERMTMVDVIRELQRIKGIFQSGQERSNARDEGPSTSHMQ